MIRPDLGAPPLRHAEQPEGAATQPSRRISTGSRRFARASRARYRGLMRYRTLGKSGMKVSPYCLGAMMFGAWGNTDHEESIRIIHAALDAGINFVDTADVYSAGESEEIV